MRAEVGLAVVDEFARLSGEPAFGPADREEPQGEVECRCGVQAIAGARCASEASGIISFLSLRMKILPSPV